MTTAAAIDIQATASDSPTKKPYLHVERRHWLNALIFLLCMSMMGLQFPPAYLFVPVILIRSLIKDRYDAAIQLTIFFGGYALIGEGTLPIKTDDIMLLVSVVGVCIYRKPPLVRKVLFGLLLYAAAIIILASYSEERMSVQIRLIRYYLGFIYFIVPLMLFAGREFDMEEFLRRLFPYIIIVCAFYVFDGFIICGQVLIPRSPLGFEGADTSKYNDLILYGIGNFPRKYPWGLFLFALVVWSIARKYRLQWYVWIIIILAFLSSKTFTMIFGVLFCLMVFQAKKTKTLGYGIAATILLAVGYMVDSTLPINPVNENSTLRIKSSLDQIFVLDESEDDEDISEFGSGRLAQAMPKFELMYKYDKQWTGLGFLHPELTKNTKYIIENEYYTDVEKSIEVATGIEISPLQVFLTIGYIGLIIHLLFFIWLYVVIRKLKYSQFYLSVMIFVFIASLGGFMGWNMTTGLAMMGLSYGAVLLANREEVWKSQSKEDSRQIARQNG
ncbi:MAG TPA: hypothetical protein PLL05_08025 [Muribaculaceae bacterium]|nr:hypothetical protein [Muribaculaceae bacterium]